MSMKEEIFRGESLTVVLRCRDRNREPVDMTGKRVEVVLADRRANPVIRFTTDATDSHRIEVDGSYLLCPLTLSDMARLQGVYLVEIRVEETVNGDCITVPDDSHNSNVDVPGGNPGGTVCTRKYTVVQIAQLPGVRVLDSITG